MAHPQLYRIRVDNFSTRNLRTEYIFGRDKAARLADVFLCEMQLTMSTGLVRMELYKHNQWSMFSCSRVTEGRVLEE